MRVAETKPELQAQLGEWRDDGDHIAVVPTMGNLHAGHVSLVELARQLAERVVVTLFVNPTQFSAGEDFADYPRTRDRDSMRLRKIGADLLFAPDVDTVYPFGMDNATTVSVPDLTENFCGAFRPGHFDGVTTVVARLFSLIQPDVAVFGQKDYQQQLVIRRLVDDLGMPIKVVTGPTVREDDGLAMSSRNAYLTDAERALAPLLFATLSDVAGSLESGNRDFDALEERANMALAAGGFVMEYVAIRRAIDLSVPDSNCRELVVLAAARLGQTRLIDNLLVTL